MFKIATNALKIAAMYKVNLENEDCQLSLLKEFFWKNNNKNLLINKLGLI